MYVFLQELPSIRNKNKKKFARKESKNTEHSKKIKSYDYAAWEKFDAVSKVIQITYSINLCMWHYIVKNLLQ